MKLHFDPNQQFQIDAINSIVGIFEGQPLNQGDFSFSIDNEGELFEEGSIGNRLILSEDRDFQSASKGALMTSLIPGHWGVVAATLVVAHWLSIRQGQALPLQLSYLLPLSKSVRKSKGHFRAPWGGATLEISAKSNY